MLSRLNLALAALLLLVAALATLTRVDYARPNREFLPDMKYSPAWQAFAANPNFPNGRTLQAPVPGTIARGELPLYFQATPEDALRAGIELRNPFHETGDNPEALARQRESLAASLARGGEIFRVYCLACHGPQGAGDGPVPQRGFPPPPSLVSGKSLQMKDGQVFHLLTYGQGNMAPFASQLTRSGRWDAINYIRDLQARAASAAAASAQPPTAPEGEPPAPVSEPGPPASPSPSPAVAPEPPTPSPPPSSASEVPVDRKNPLRERR